MDEQAQFFGTQYSSMVEVWVVKLFWKMARSRLYRSVRLNFCYIHVFTGLLT